MIISDSPAGVSSRGGARDVGRPTFRAPESGFHFRMAQWAPTSALWRVSADVECPATRGAGRGTRSIVWRKEIPGSLIGVADLYVLEPSIPEIWIGELSLKANIVFQ